jgi:nitrogen PTS system EIIA component
MDLCLKDIQKLLNVSEKTIYRLIRDSKMPAYRIGHQYRFNRAEINEWILQNKIPVAEGLLDLGLTKKPVSLALLLRRGGVFDGIGGELVGDVIRNTIDAIPTPPEADKERVCSSLIEREQLMSTAVGHGVAIPHPRNPIISDIEHESLSVCYLSRPVDFLSIDREMVSTLLVLFSANAKHHLEALSKISSLCKKSDFLALLESRAPADRILPYIEAVEAEWARAKDQA